MEERVHVEESSLNELKNAFNEAGEDYKANFDKLTNLINEITLGHIQGDPADNLSQKYDEKKEDFKKVYEMITSIQDYTNARTEQFVNDIDSLNKNMK